MLRRSQVADLGYNGPLHVNVVAGLCEPGEVRSRMLTNLNYRHYSDVVNEARALTRRCNERSNAPMRSLLLILVLGLAFSAMAGDLRLRDGSVFRNTKIVERKGDKVDLFVAGFGLQSVPFAQLMPEDQKAVLAQEKAAAEAAAAEAAKREANRKAAEAAVAARMEGVKTIALKTKKGKTFEGITSWEWEKNNRGVKINYPGGIAHLMVDDLDDASQKLLKEAKP